MKKLFLALTIGLTAMACSRLEKGEQLTSDLVGTWKKVGIKIDGAWVSLNENYHTIYYTFKEDNTFLIDGVLYEGCRSGTYSLTKDGLLSLNFSKHSCSDSGENLNNPYIYKIKIEDKKLYLTSKDYSEKFIKISNQ